MLRYAFMYSSLLTFFIPALLATDELDETRKDHMKRQTQVGVTSTDENLIFSSPELIAMVTDHDGTELFLEAFKIKENDQILLAIPMDPSKVGSLRFLSLGHPKIVFPTRHGQCNKATWSINVTPLGFHFYVEMLPFAYREALASAANSKLQTSVRVSPSQIVMLTPNSFTCTMAVATSDGLTTTVQGKVKTFRTNPLKVDFELSRNSSLYKDFRSGILTSDAVTINCEVIRKAHNARTDQLIITSQQIDQLNLQNKLFGPADSSYVTRHQMDQLGREIVHNLHVFESYETDGGFESNFVTDLLQHFGIQNAFTPLPIAEVLSSLSPYNVGTDLRPEEITRELSDVLKIETVDGKQHIVTNRESSQLQRESSSSSGGWSVSGGYGPFKVGATANHANSKSGEWSSSGKSLDDQLTEINNHSQSAVKYERVGLKVVPKSLDVARISRSALSQSIKFSRVRRKLNSADFRREFELLLPHTDGSTAVAKISGWETRRQGGSVHERSSCQTSSDCSEWNTPDFKLIQSCGDAKICSCISPGLVCQEGLCCCDGSICNTKCPPAAKFYYCRTTVPSSCQPGLTCTVDSVSLRITPEITQHRGRCL